MIVVPDDAGGHRGRQPPGPGAPGDPGRGRRADRQRRPARRGHLPRRPHARAGGRLPGRPEPRAPHRRHRPLRLPARGVRLREADQRHPLLPRRAWPPTRTRSSRWRRRRDCTGTRRRCGCGRGAAGPAIRGQRGSGASDSIRYGDAVTRCAHAARGPAPAGFSSSPRVFMVVEAVGGWIAGSLALLADAGHMLTDVGALALSLLTAWIAQRPADDSKTYGYLRWEILAALVNGAALFGIAAGWWSRRCSGSRTPSRSGPASSWPSPARGCWSTWPASPCSTPPGKEASTSGAPTSTCWATRWARSARSRPPGSSR